MKKLAIIIPTYNEKENIANLIKATSKVLAQCSINTTIFIVDDNSPDGTGKIVDRLAAKFKKDSLRITPIHRPSKLGLASAYIETFKVAIKQEFDYMLSMDADFSHQPKYIPIFLKQIRNYDLVIGSRNIKGGTVENWGLIRQIISKGGSFYSRTILGLDIKDVTGGFNMYQRNIFKKIKLDKIHSRGYSFQIEMKYRIVQEGFQVCEIPIIFPDRKLGKAKMNSKILLEALIRVWQIRFSS